MHHDDFEEFGHRVARAAYPAVQRTRAPDSGADSILPKEPGAGWTRAWQAKRRKNIDWGDCERSLDKALSVYAVEHYTFIFPYDLSDGQLLKFNKRLRVPNPRKTIDWWGMTELVARLEETAHGRQVTRFFFGAPRAELEADWLAAQQLGGGPLVGVDDLMGRLSVLGAWLQRRQDGSFAYAESAWTVPEAQTQPAQAAFMTYSQHRPDGSGSRIDVIPGQHPPAGPWAQLRVDFTPDEAGQNAALDLDWAEQRGAPVHITSGVLVTWELLPGALFDEHLGDTRSGELTLTPQTGPPPARDAFLRVEGPDGTEELDMHFEGIVLDGWELAWRGTHAGLTATVALRRLRGDKGETFFKVEHELTTTDPAREQLRALKMMRALYEKGTAVFGDHDKPHFDLPVRLDEDDDPSLVDGLLQTIGALVTIEDWTGEQMPVPPQMSAETAELLASTAVGIRQGGFAAVIVGDIVVPDDDVWKELRGASDRMFRMHEEIGIDVNGREIWLGVLDYDLRDFTIRQSKEKGKLILRPKNKKARQVTGRLHRERRLVDVPVPEGFETTSAEHRKRASEQD